MAADSFLSALVGNYASSDPAADNLATVRGLLSYCRKWPRGEVGAEELNNPCFEMSTRLREGASRMEASLNGNPVMTAETSWPISRTAQAYLAIAEVLEELPALAREGREEEFIDNLDLFEQERQAVLQAQKQIEVQLSGKVPLCPRCGSGGEESLCSDCQLTRLYPDPKALAEDDEASEVAGVYGEVYQAYRSAILGEASLDPLWTGLDQLEAHLEDLTLHLKELFEGLQGEAVQQESPSESATLEALLTAVESEILAAHTGLERMREAESSLRVYDLQLGWDEIYHASRAIEATASKVRREIADHDET